MLAPGLSSISHCSTSRLLKSDMFLYAPARKVAAILMNWTDFDTVIREPLSDQLLKDIAKQWHLDTSVGICVSMFFTAEDIFRSRMQIDENRNVPLLLYEEFRFDDKAKHLLLDTEKNKTLDFGQFLSIKEISGLIEGDHPGSPLDVPYYFLCRNELYMMILDPLRHN